VFQDIDIARVRLVYDLRRAMAIAEDMMPLVLSLLDQVYELRGELAAISSALKAQPADVRDAVLAALERRTG
jgi:chaperone modulatory protein CbpM